MCVPVVPQKESSVARSDRKPPITFEEKVTRLVRAEEKLRGINITYVEYVSKKIGFVPQSPIVNYYTK